MPNASFGSADSFEQFRPQFGRNLQITHVGHDTERTRLPGHTLVLRLKCFLIGPVDGIKDLPGRLFVNREPVIHPPTGFAQVVIEREHRRIFAVIGLLSTKALATDDERYATFFGKAPDKGL